MNIQFAYAAAVAAACAFICWIFSFFKDSSYLISSSFVISSVRLWIRWTRIS
jgi:hypothetical protein